MVTSRDLPKISIYPNFDPLGVSVAEIQNEKSRDKYLSKNVAISSQIIVPEVMKQDYNFWTDITTLHSRKNNQNCLDM